MSAFMCSDYHISAIANVWNRRSFIAPHAVRLTCAGAHDAYALLWEANAASVRYRYSDADASGMIGEMGPHNWDAHVRASGGGHWAVSAIKAAQCLDYQSCEVPDWRGSPAQQYLQAVINYAISELPGYDAAPWAIKAPDYKALREAATTGVAQ